MKLSKELRELANRPWLHRASGRAKVLAAAERSAKLEQELAVRDRAICIALCEDSSVLPREPNETYKDWRSVNEQLATKFEQVLAQARQEAEDEAT